MVFPTVTVPYAYPYNLTVSLPALLDYVNSLTKNMFGLGFLVTLGVILFISTKQYTYEKALAFSTFVVALSAVFLRFLNLINDTILAGSVILFVGSLVLLWKERESEQR